MNDEQLQQLIITLGEATSDQAAHFIVMLRNMREAFRKVVPVSEKHRVALSDIINFIDKYEVVLMESVADLDKLLIGIY